MDVATVMRLLEATLSPDNAARMASEAAIKDLQTSAGWPSGLLQVISAPASSPNVRLASALALKRASTSTWHSDDPNERCPYPPEVKEYGAFNCARARAHALARTHSDVRPACAPQCDRNSSP